MADKPEEKLLDAEIENWFTYHVPTEANKVALVAIRAKAKEMAYIIKEHTPRCADQTVALRHLRDAVMVANAAVVIPQLNRMS